MIAFWIVFLSGIITVFTLFSLISLGAFGKLPTFEQLENPQSALATQVISDDGFILGVYYSENRSNITYDELPQNLVEALIATEDERFYEHSGIDFIAIGRVLRGLITGEYAGGGSTVTQQLAKNLFPREDLNTFELVIRKFKEWVIAVKLERSYTKEEIIAMYLNTVEFSDNAFGIHSASSTYFNKEPIELLAEESAVLVGMLKAPYKFNPRINPEASKDRRNVVLMKMEEAGFISSTQLDTMSPKDIQLEFKAASHSEGLAPYFREVLRLELKKWTDKNPKPDGTKWDIYRDGLKIYTTLDSRMQEYAEDAVKNHLTGMQDIFWDHWDGRDPWKDFNTEFERAYVNLPRYNQLLEEGLNREEIDTILNQPIPMKVFTWYGELDTVMSVTDSLKFARMFLQAGFMVMDPHTGFIKAWVGGINYKYYQFDHVNINTKRQVGSTFKPFVYTVAIKEKGYSPCHEIPNELVTFESSDPRWNILKDWTPKNADGRYGGMLSLEMGLANSVNTITAHLMHEMTPEAVIELVRDMGISEKTNIDPVPAICLGTPDISLYEMVGAYTTFANKGIFTQPIFISRIEDKNGNLIQEFTPYRNEVLDEQTAYVMVDLMRNVISQGTGRKLRYMYDMSNEIIGKTGTTQNQSDGWFIGLTPDLIAGAWVGCEDRFVRFRTIRYGQGASLALPIWGNFFQSVMSDSTLAVDFTAKFEKPETELTIDLDCYSSKSTGTSSSSGYGDEFEDR